MTPLKKSQSLVKKIVHNPKINSPTEFIIFGATGDLSRKKLIPALFDLFTKGFLPKEFFIVGFALSRFDDEKFRQFAIKAIEAKGHHHKKSELAKFIKRLYFISGDFEKKEKFDQLKKRLHEIDQKGGCIHNKFLYLAVPPKAYQTILKNVDESGITRMCADSESWIRVMIEKPFGNDLESAKKLNNLLAQYFNEDQIYRIDHYLAKETVQNILSFRFSNTLFEPVFNSKYVDKIEIKIREKIGVEGRGLFYDRVGALRDVGQNHILQLLALVTMEHPGEANPYTIRHRRAQLLESLKPIPTNNISDYALRGQYKGYSKVEGVKKGSETETYFKIKAFIENDRWSGVPMYLESGKKLFETKTKITIYFKEGDILGEQYKQKHPQNRLVFRIQPDEGITVVFWAKKPGFNNKLESKKLTFYYNESEAPSELTRIPDAYEKVLFDCMQGDQTLFPSKEEIEASWAFITPIIKALEETKLHTYKPGEYGPKARTNFW